MIGLHGIRSALGACALLTLVMPQACAAPAAAHEGRGEYLFHAADCQGCHENPTTHALSGGRAITLPIGRVYATNLTPDYETGIGAYTDAQWLRMMHHGIARDGRHLYPVMPYASYARMTDADALAIKSYLSGLVAIRTATPPAEMRFPFNLRFGLVLWNWINVPSRPFTGDPNHSDAWNRGAYLAEALGHCGECHTPRNWLYAMSHRHFAGAVQEGWLAYNLTSNPEHGLGRWSNQSLVDYLHTGQAAGHGPASGPMALVVQNSLSHLDDGDLQALVAYLRSVPARSDGPPMATNTHPDPLAQSSTRGGRLFNDACAGCHLSDGTGRQIPWAALGGAHSMADPDATNIHAVLTQGTAITTPIGTMMMHTYTGGYSESERAAIARYLQAHFGKP